jgi:hypothetical protein
MTGEDREKFGILDIVIITVTILGGIFVLVQFIKWAWSF